MRDYAISCEGTQKYASLASVCKAPFCARVASSHASKYAPTPLLMNTRLFKQKEACDAIVSFYFLR